MSHESKDVVGHGIFKNGSITEKTVLSLHVVVLFLGVTIWLVRMSATVDANHQVIVELQNELAKSKKIQTKHDWRLYRCEEKLKLPHPRYSDEGD